MAIVNGEYTDTISCADRGLHYGDGLFETLAVHDGQPLCWSLHLERLRDGCSRLAIPAPDAQQLYRQALQSVQDLPLGVLKIIVTRGSGGRGYRPPKDPVPSHILSVHAWPDYPATWAEQGIRARFCSVRLAVNPLLAGIKHLNRLEQVLARMEWDDPEIAEGIMLDAADHVIEGTATNLFACRTGVLYTPRLDGCGVAGVMRALVLQAAATLGIPTREAPLERSAVVEADELFVCNSLAGIWPIIQLDERYYNSPGSVTRRLQGFLREQPGVLAGAGP